MHSRVLCTRSFASLKRVLNARKDLNAFAEFSFMEDGNILIKCMDTFGLSQLTANVGTTSNVSNTSNVNDTSNDAKKMDLITTSVHCDGEPGSFFMTLLSTRKQAITIQFGPNTDLFVRDANNDVLLCTLPFMNDICLPYSQPILDQDVLCIPYVSEDLVTTLLNLCLIHPIVEMSVADSKLSFVARSELGNLSVSKKLNNISRHLNYDLTLAIKHAKVVANLLTHVALCQLKITSKQMDVVFESDLLCGTFSFLRYRFLNKRKDMNTRTLEPRPAWAASHSCFQVHARGIYFLLRDVGAALNHEQVSYEISLSRFKFKAYAARLAHYCVFHVAIFQDVDCFFVEFTKTEGDVKLMAEILEGIISRVPNVLQTQQNVTNRLNLPPLDQPLDEKLQNWNKLLREVTRRISECTSDITTDLFCSVVEIALELRIQDLFFDVRHDQRALFECLRAMITSSSLEDIRLGAVLLDLLPAHAWTKEMIFLLVTQYKVTVFDCIQFFFTFS